MSLKRRLPLLLLILGIFVFIIGIVLAAYIQEGTVYAKYEGFLIPHSDFTQPYVVLGIAVMLSGIILIIMALLENYRQNKISS